MAQTCSLGSPSSTHFRITNRIEHSELPCLRRSRCGCALVLVSRIVSPYWNDVVFAWLFEKAFRATPKTCADQRLGSQLCFTLRCSTLTLKRAIEISKKLRICGLRTSRTGRILQLATPCSRRVFSCRTRTTYAVAGLSSERHRSDFDD